MKHKRRSIIGNIFLVIFICLNLTNVNAARFDGDPPPTSEVVEETETQDENESSTETQSPVPVETEEPTQDEANTTEQTSSDDVVATEEPQAEEPIATEQPPTEEAVGTEEPQAEEPIATEEPPTEVMDETEAVSPEDENSEEEIAPEDESVAELLSEAPENTNIVVLDENGDTVPLVSEEAADIIVEEDPMWCPSGVLPGGSGCTTNYSSISALINELTGSRRNRYEQDGIIYFTSGNTNGSFNLTRSNIGTSDFNALNDYNLTLQGGWNGSNLGGATFTGITNFGSNTLTIGDSYYRWQGNISLINFSFSNVTNGNSITVYTDGGDISLDNISVSQQGGEDYTAYLDSNSGDITVEASYFDGNDSSSWFNSGNRGFSAQTNNGSIEITDTTFQEAYRRGNTDYNGTTLEAPTITLNDVVSRNNDGTGIYINNASNTTVTLNNVSGLNNGDSGVFIEDSYPTIVTVNGGTYSNNGRYGIEFQRRRGTLYVTSNPLCQGNRYYGYDGCYNIEPTILSTAPTLNLPGDITAEATSPAGAVVSFNVTASDAQDDPDPIPTCSPASGSTFPIGTTTVDCSVTDSDDNTTEGSFTITVIDSPPVLNLPGNITAEATSLSGAVVNFIVTATDVMDGPLTPTCSETSGTFPIGDTTVDCSVTDSGGHTTAGSFTITVYDSPPVLSLPGDITAEATSPAGAAVNFSATATDLIDGPIPVICSPASGSTFPITGWFSSGVRVDCSATDSGGNTVSGSFRVRVRDTTPPALNAQNTTAEATGPSGAIVNFTVTATDLVDPSPYLSCNHDPGELFPIGTTTVTCWMFDSSFNFNIDNFTVTVQDTTPPTINLPADITEEATSPSGAVVTFSASATDLVDGPRPVTCTPPSGSTFVLGTTAVTCESSDTRGNTARDSFNVTVQDTIPPTLNLPSDITDVEATGPGGAVVTFTVTATDIADSTPTVSCSPSSGSTFGLGTTIVNCSATDDSGNSTSGSFNVTVVDTTPPTLTLPSDIIEEATDPSGAVIYFSVSANDLVSGSVAVTCSEVSGSTFPITVTTVNCWATDYLPNSWPTSVSNGINIVSR